ncbi:MAG: hypothetical protein Q7S18_03630 [bacterium]|nr:hypothetical protein [bacterium]
MKYIAEIILILSILFIPVVCFAAESSTEKPGEFYYIYLIYNLKNNTIKINPDNSSNDSVSVSNLKFTSDTIINSQFYAQVVDLKNEIKTFAVGGNKFYLGNWKLVRFWDGIDADGKPVGGAEQLDEGEVNISVPFFSDGKTVNIYDAKNNRLALSIDVSKFAENNASKKIETYQNGSDKNQTQANDLNNKKAKISSWIVLMIVFVVVSVIAGSIWYFRKQMNLDD